MISDDGGAYTHFCHAKSSKKSSSSKQRRKVPVRKTDVCSSIFHRTELIFGGSRAKNCQESARTLRLCAAAQKNTKSSVLSALGVVAARVGNWKDDLFGNQASMVEQRRNFRISASKGAVQGHGLG